MKDLFLLSDIDVGSELLSLYVFDILICTAECFLAVPEVFIDTVFTAVVEASATDGMRAVAKVMAGPAKTVVVVGAVIQSPSLFVFISPPDATARSPDVTGAVAEGIDADVDSVVCMGAVAKFMAGLTNLLVVVGVIFVPPNLLIVVSYFTS